MIKPFNIVRDLENKRYTEGSDNIVLTQFDKGIKIDFYILLSGKPLVWNNRVHSAKVTFKNGDEIVVDRTPCAYDDVNTKLVYEIDGRLTQKFGQVKGIIDIEAGGTRVASSQFELVILEHLAKN